MEKIYINKDITIDWYKQYHVRALNLEDKLFEKVNDFCGDDAIVINIDENYLKDSSITEWDEIEISEKLKEEEYYSSNRIIFVLYSPDNRLVGYIEQLDTFGL